MTLIDELARALEAYKFADEAGDHDDFIRARVKADQALARYAATKAEGAQAPVAIGWVSELSLKRLGWGQYAMIWPTADGASTYHEENEPDTPAHPVYTAPQSLPDSALLLQESAVDTFAEAYGDPRDGWDEDAIRRGLLAVFGLLHH